MLSLATMLVAQNQELFSIPALQINLMDVKIYPFLEEYQHGNYKDFIKQYLNQKNNINKEDTYFPFYVGIAYMEQGKYRKALKYLKPLSSDPDKQFPLHNWSCYYVALIYLEQKKHDMALKALRRSRNDNTSIKLKDLTLKDFAKAKDDLEKYIK